MGQSYNNMRLSCVAIKQRRDGVTANTLRAENAERLGRCGLIDYCPTFMSEMHGLCTGKGDSGGLNVVLSVLFCH